MDSQISRGGTRICAVVSFAQIHTDSLVRVRGISLTNADSLSSGFESSVFDSVFVTGSELSFSVIGSNRFKGPGFFVVDLHVKVIMAAASC